MKKHIVRGLILTGAVALVLSGCGQKPLSNGGASQGSENSAVNSQATPTPTPSEAPQNAKKEPLTKQIKAYYGDDQAEKLVEKEVTINYNEDKDKYTASLWTLKKAPENSNLIPLAQALGFKSAVLKEGKLTLDMTMSNEGRLGAPGESMLLQAIQKTLFQFPEVESIDILVDGKAVDSLMGHMDLPHPIKR
ncbi:GerMN domain-containing protein [Paenibacillus sp. RC67]|uniref:GerMN domain-containing protein n=1 Tax=Paenibacillus sp. RC67 TaxID=3039392 RepID=UPI0024AD7842|nr:GerMN domain-containing protein [Paenibacillus sp. RC67]